MELYSEKRMGDTGERETMKTVNKCPRLDSKPGFGKHMSSITELSGATPNPNMISLTFHSLVGLFIDPTTYNTWGMRFKVMQRHAI